MGCLARKPVLMTVLLVFVALAFAGCLQSQHDTLVRYDATADQFAVLNVYRGYRAEKPEDLDHLEWLWRNRASIYEIPLIPTLQKMPDGTFRKVRLTEATTQPATWDIPVALDGLKLIPGKLFVEDEVLCYYDQVIVPGKLVDALLPYATKAVEPDLIKTLNQELEARRGGGPAASWERLRAGIRDELRQEQTVQLQELLSTESLKIIKEGVEKGTLRITRQKQLFSVAIPLSAGDVKEAAGTLRLWDQRVKQKAAKEGNDREVARAYLRSAKWEEVPGGIRVTVDATALFPGLDAFGVFQPTIDETIKSEDATAAMEQRKLPIARDVHAAEIAEQFSKGTLDGKP